MLNVNTSGGRNRPYANHKGDVTEMSIEKVRAYLKEMECPKEVLEFETSSATVELAAQAAGVIPARITDRKSVV